MLRFWQQKQNKNTYKLKKIYIYYHYSTLPEMVTNDLISPHIAALYDYSRPKLLHCLDISFQKTAVTALLSRRTEGIFPVSKNLSEKQGAAQRK